MLGTIFNLFGKSPFAALQTHMDKVSLCVFPLKELFDALKKKDYFSVETIAGKISDQEHQADLTKNDIRNHLPRSLFLPIDRGHLLEILAIQDKIADMSEDIAVLTTLKHLEILPEFNDDFFEFLHKNMTAFEGARLIIKEMHELLESSFGGTEAQKVRVMVEDVAFKEHECDLVQRKLLKQIFALENKMSYGSFYLWQKILESLAGISNLSESLANRIRMTLEIK